MDHSVGSKTDSESEKYMNPKTGKRYSRSHIFKLQNPDKYEVYTKKRDASFWREYYATKRQDATVFCECCEIKVVKCRMHQHVRSDKHKRKQELFNMDKK